MLDLSVFRSTGSFARSAVKTYFEPLLWLRRTFRQSSERSNGEWVVLEKRLFAGVFLATLLLSGVFFTLGYTMGRSAYGGRVYASFGMNGYSGKGPIFFEVATPGPAGDAIAIDQRQNDAIRLWGELQQFGYPVAIVAPPSDKYYHVLVGPYPDGQSATTARRSLEAKGFKLTVRQ
jgi:SPOR domain